MLFSYFGIYALAFLKYLTKLFIHRIIIAVEVHSRINPGNITDNVFFVTFFRCTWVKKFDPPTLPKKQRQVG